MSFGEVAYGETELAGTLVSTPVSTAYVMQTIIGQQLADELWWWPSTDDTWLYYLDAIGGLFQQTAAITNDIGVDGEPGYQTGYGSIFTVNPRFEGDTAICPTDQLPFVGQFVGVSIPPSADDATARSLITSEQGLQRGSSSAIDAAASRYLDEGQTLTHLSRETPQGTPNPFYFTLVVNPPFTAAEQTTTVPQLVAAVNAVTPAWMQWSLVQTTGTTWAQLSGTWSTWTGTWAGTGA